VVASGLAPEAVLPPRLGVLRRHRHFRNVWLGSMVSNVGGWMEAVGIQWIVAKTTGSPVMMANLAALQLGPTLVLGMVGGLTADRVNRRTLLLVTQGAMMIIAVALAGASFYWDAAPPIPVLLLLSLLQGIALAFNTPAWQVLTPRLVPREDLTQAIALNGLQFNLARVLGPALAGALMAAYSPTLLFVINAISFVVVLLAISTTPDAPAPPRDARSILRQTTEALSFMFHRRGPRAVFLATVIFATLAAPLMRMLPLFAKDVYTEGDPLLGLLTSLPFGTGTPREIVFGWLLTLLGAGAVVGALALGHIPRWYPKHHFIPLSIMLGGIAIAAFSASRSLLLASIILFFGGIAWFWAFNVSMQALQLRVPDQMRGRVMSVNNMAVFGAMPVGAFLAGLIGKVVNGGGPEGLSAQVGVGTLGAALACSGIIMLIWRTPEVDGICPGEPGYDRRPGLLRGLTARAHRPP
jgi:MFS transporter, DHA1 family, staphyloferrin A biosynthesis exporter